MRAGVIKSRPISAGASIRRWFWPAILAGYGSYFAYLLFSKRLMDLVSPRMTAFVALGFAAILLLLAAQIRRLLLGGPGRKSRPGLFLFLIPFAFLPFSQKGTGILLVGGGEMSLEQGGTQLDLTTKLHKAVNPFVPDPPRTAATKGGAIPASGPILLDESNYYSVYQELYDDPAAFAGRTIQASGFVYPEPGHGTHTFIMARELMWCCAADAVGIGFMTQGHDAELPKRYSWVSVRGKLSTATYTDHYTGLTSAVPMIQVESMDRLKEPDFVFVYPK